MKVSILIPTKNRLALLQEAVESARAQTHGNIEILVSDDGSNDGTCAWLEQLTTSDHRVRLAPRNPTPGLFENINHLLDHQRGDAFCVLADDDRLSPGFVAALLEPMQSWSDVVVTFSDFWQMDANGDRLAELSLRESAHTGRAELPGGIVAEPVPIALRNILVLGFALYRATLVGRQRFDLTCGGAADIDFHLRMAALGRFVYVPLRLGEVRVHPERASGTRYRYMTSGSIRALSKHRFEDPTWEALRLHMLQGRRASYAAYLRDTDPIECLKTVASYLADSKPSQLRRHLPTLAASVIVACLPQRPAARLLGLAKALRARR